MRGDRGFTLDEVLPGFRQASDWYLGLVRSVGEDQWDLPGLGEWNVRELIGHASRAYLTVERSLQPSGTIDVDTAAEYFRRAVPGPEANVAIADRGRAEGAALATDPGPLIASRAASALAAVEEAPPGAVCVTFAGTLSLADYLATRVVELTIHSLDLADALGAEAAEPPEAASLVALIVLTALAAEPSPAALLRSLTGRAPLPLGFSVFP